MILLSRKPSSHPRRGAVAVLACLMLIALMGILAFAIDLSYLTHSRAELQRSADAAALASCYQLMDTRTPVNLSSNIAQIPAIATQYAGLNRVCNSTPTLANSDIVVGLLSNPTVSGGTINTAANQNMFNAVQVTVRRTSAENGQVPTFFGRVLGVDGMNVSATATAALMSNFIGFKTPSSNGGTDNVMLMPFALDQQTWNALLAGSTAETTDAWSYTSGGQVVAGSDGIREVNLFPQGTGSPGNRGTVDLGNPNNSTADVVRQIQFGISPSDLAWFSNSQICLDSTGHLYLNADPGISAGFKSALSSIIGKTRIIPIFSTVAYNGNNAMYDIVGFQGVRIMAVNLTGAMSKKCLTVQPAAVYSRGGIPNTTSTTQTSYGVFSPIFLVK